MTDINKKQDPNIKLLREELAVAEYGVELNTFILKVCEKLAEFSDRRKQKTGGYYSDFNHSISVMCDFAKTLIK